jgi:hypothetical protein
MKLFAAPGTAIPMSYRNSTACVLVTCLWLLSCAGASPPDGGTGGDGGADAGGTGGGTADGGGADAGPTVEKFLFLFDGARSMGVTDPNGTRIAALGRFLDALPNEDRVSIAVMVFEGSVAGFVASPVPQFVPVTSLTQADRSQALMALANFTAPGSVDAGSMPRDFVAALSTAYSLMYRDTMQVLTYGEPLARYTIVFVSDGAPTYNQDDELLCGDAVSRIRSLAVSAKDVRFHTVHLFTPALALPPTCAADAGLTVSSACALPTVSQPCPPVEVNLAADRLRRMAVLGGGTFRDFRDHEEVDFGALVPVP